MKKLKPFIPFLGIYLMTKSETTLNPRALITASILQGVYMVITLASLVLILN